MRKTLLALSVAAALAGCGDDDSKRRAPVTGGTGGGDPVSDVIEISGAALAPAGSLAQLEQHSPVRVVLNFLVSPVAAAITGLSPVVNAQVELYRVDNSGARVGDVLDSTTTDSDGNYELELPEGEELGGDLIVVISANGGEMRAQVVDEEVDVTPISEYLLQKFIDSGSDLSAIQPAALLELKSKIEEVDLAAGTDMTDLLSRLDATVGDYVNEAVEVIVAGPGDASNLNGAYRNLAFQWGFDNGPQLPGGGYLVDTWITQLTLRDGAQGAITVDVGEEKEGFAELRGADLLGEGGVDNEPESLQFSVASNGTISFQQGLEEDERGIYYEQSLPKIYKFRKVHDRNIFVMDANDTYFYYDPEDLSEHVGHQVFRGIELLTRKPASAAASDLDGDFGRVHIGTHLRAGGSMHIEAEHNIMSFNGTGAVDLFAAPRYTLIKNADGTVTFLDETSGEEPGLLFELSSDGQFTFEGEVQANDVYVNDSFDLIVGNEFWFEDDAELNDNHYSTADSSVTLAVKLPEQMLTLDERVYRIYQVENELSDNYHGLNAILPASLLTMTTQETASITGTVSDLHFGTVAIENDSLDGLSASVALEANGKVVISVEEEGDLFTMTGFFNETGSMAVLQTVYQPAEESVSALGVAILLEVK